MTPQIVQIRNGQAEIPLPKGLTEKTAVARFLGFTSEPFTDSYAPDFLGAFRLDNGMFTLASAYVSTLYEPPTSTVTIATGKYPGDQIFHLSEFYYPLDSRLVEKDIRRATRAKTNAAGDAWLFYHLDEDYMDDREVEIRAGVTAVFQPVIDELILGVLTATDTKPTSWPIGVPWETRNVRRNKAQLLVDFRNKAVATAIAAARERYIGWYQQNEADSHLHSLISAAITATKKAHQAARTFNIVDDKIANALKSLTEHTYLSRWDQEAAKKKKEAGDDDGGNGS